MSQENVEIARRTYDAWNRGDLEAILDLLAPDFEFHTAQLFSDTEAIYRGREGYRDFWNTFRVAWQNITVDSERIVDLGDDRVLALFTFHGKGQESGVEVSVEYANLGTLRDGLFVQIRGFDSWDEALEAIGLEE